MKISRGYLLKTGKAYRVKKLLNMIYVIGSGMAGVSATMALMKRGYEVTMLDAGFELEQEKAEIIKRMRIRDKIDWDNNSINLLKENVSADFGGVDVKYVYGSDYPYRGMELYQPVKLKGAKIVRSLARGGLSNVWGASILPYRESDIKDWPITVKDLEAHYFAVLSFMKSVGIDEELCSLFSIDGTQREFSACKQISALMRDLESNKDALKTEGFSFGYSRLAVNFKPGMDNRGCNYCGMCLFGCPYGLIYSSSTTLNWLLSNEHFYYYNNIMVEKLVESGDKVKILAKSLISSENLEFEGSIVFLAAGTVSSTRILLQSLEAFYYPLIFKHSDHFQIPLLRFKNTSKITTEEMHTLTQIFIELIDGSISENTIHMQVYGYNELYFRVMSDFLGSIFHIMKLPVEELLGRILVIKGYLHSSISSTILAYLEKGEHGSLVLKGKHNVKATEALKKIKSKLIKNRRYFKAIPIPKMSRLGIPGIGNHSGGTFPMKERPLEFESDKFGRPYGFKKVHVVDSTVFPSIPATTISLSIMANAHRIASEY